MDDTGSFLIAVLAWFAVLALEMAALVPFINPGTTPSPNTLDLSLGIFAILTGATMVAGWLAVKFSPYASLEGLMILLGIMVIGPLIMNAQDHMDPASPHDISDSIAMIGAALAACGVSYGLLKLIQKRDLGHFDRR